MPPHPPAPAPAPSSLTSRPARGSPTLQVGIDTDCDTRARRQEDVGRSRPPPSISSYLCHTHPLT